MIFRQCNSKNCNGISCRHTKSCLPSPKNNQLPFNKNTQCSNAAQKWSEDSKCCLPSVSSVIISSSLSSSSSSPSSSCTSLGYPCTSPDFSSTSLAFSCTPSLGFPSPSLSFPRFQVPSSTFADCLPLLLTYQLTFWQHSNRQLYFEHLGETTNNRNSI